MSSSIQIRPFKERNAGRGTRQLACLDKAIGRMKKYADKGRRPMVGDKVMLKLTPQIWKKISSKTVLYTGFELSSPVNSQTHSTELRRPAGRETRSMLA